MSRAQLRSSSFFNSALLRKPGKSIIYALSSRPVTLKPDFVKALEQHHHYAASLKEMGLSPVICEANEEFPDGCFTEDTHLVLPEIIIRLNPGAPSRANEPDSLVDNLPKNRPYVGIAGQLTIDGGDILVTDKRLYVGLSKRTSSLSVTALEKLISQYDYQILSVAVPSGLHLKSGVTCLNQDIFIIQKLFEEILVKLHEQLGEKKTYFIVPDDEDFAANVLPLNDSIMIPAHCPKTKEFILRFYSSEKVFEVDTSEFRKIDGALTCLSIPFHV